MRKCMFCKSQALTNEDAWPVWLTKAIPGVGPGTNYATRGDDDLKPWKSQKPQQKVKYVCGECNNGWMSRLENQVKPIVTDIFNLLYIQLDSTSQMTLAAWSVKTAMVLEALTTPKLVFSGLGTRSSDEDSSDTHFDLCMGSQMSQPSRRILIRSRSWWSNKSIFWIRPRLCNYSRVWASGNPNSQN